MSRVNWPVVAAAVWAVGLVGLGVDGYRHPRGRTVFDIYRVAGLQWWDGSDLFPRQEETGDPPPGYTVFDALRAAELAWWGGATPYPPHEAPTHELYRYSPLYAVLSAPFVVLPPGAGNAAWKVVNGAVFAAAVWAWCRRGLPGPPTRNQSAAVVALCIPAALQSLYTGQANLLMTAAVLLGLTAAAEDRWWRAAGFVAAATLIKVFPLALAMLLGVLFWRQFPWRFAVALLIGLVLPFATQRPDYVWRQTAAWFGHLVESNELNRDRLRSLNGLFEAFGAPVDPKLFLLLAAAAGAVVLGVSLGSARRDGDRRVVFWRVGAWFLTWSVLFSPSTENPTFSILAPVVAWGIVEAFGRRSVQGCAEAAWLLVALYLMNLSTTDAGGPLKHYFHTYAGTTVGAGMVQLWLVADLVRPRRLVPSPLVGEG